MVLEGYRQRLDLFFDPLSRSLINVNPNIISFSSLLFAVLAGASLALSGRWLPEGRWDWALFLALAFTGLNAIADTIDGRVARMAGTESPVGDFLDHTFDRLSDVAILLGVAISPYCNTTFGFVSVIFVLLSSYMGTQSQAVGAGRNYSGIMGRADRMVLMMFVLPFQFILRAFFDASGIMIMGRNIIPMEVLMGILLVGGALTTFTRGYSTFRYLGEKGRSMENNGSRSGRQVPRRPGRRP